MNRSQASPGAMWHIMCVDGLTAIGFRMLFIHGLRERAVKSSSMPSLGE